MNEIETKFIDSLLRFIKTEPCEFNTKLGYVRIEYNQDDSISEDHRFCLVLKRHTASYLFDVSLCQQKTIGKYRVDFLFDIYNSKLELFCVVVEIDGHEWHEKTKQQAQADRKRERDLLSYDYPVMRFTGSEVFHNSDECAKECLNIIISRMAYKISERFEA